ncbi:MAG: hypothetical protein WD067_04960 [Gaiellaceae bacterium]
MLSQGPFSARLHGLAEYVLGGFFIAAPFIFGFEADAAVAIAVVGGVILIVVAATSQTGPSFSRLVPPTMHVALDVVIAAFLVAAPFIFGFSDEAAPTGLFIGVGVVHLLSTIGTRFVAAPAEHP